ncbi:MAG: DUF1858 domain-containing protein [Devosia sp.]
MPDLRHPVFAQAQGARRRCVLFLFLGQEESRMPKLDLSDASVGDIMSRYPETIGVFLDFRLHCIGCPISGFHTLADAALEHGVSEAALRAAIEQTVAQSCPRVETRSGFGRGASRFRS